MRSRQPNPMQVEHLQVRPGFGGCGPGLVQAALRCGLLAIALVPLASGAVGVRSGTARISLPVTSVRSLRDAAVVKQQYDYSCGAAALATLLTYGLGDPVDEQPLLTDLLQLISEEDQSTVKRQGLSLLDLKAL